VDQWNIATTDVEQWGPSCEDVGNPAKFAMRVTANTRPLKSGYNGAICVKGSPICTTWKWVKCTYEQDRCPVAIAQVEYTDMDTSNSVGPPRRDVKPMKTANAQHQPIKQPGAESGRFSH
jgi:hypothetical protein